MARYTDRRRRTGGSRWMTLRYDGICKVCGADVLRGATGYYDAENRTVTCTRLDCAEADCLVRTEPLTGPWDKRTDLRVLADSRHGGRPAPVAFSRPRSPAHRAARVAVLNSGAVLSVTANGRCEDSPCCGCCT